MSESTIRDINTLSTTYQGAIQDFGQALAANGSNATIGDIAVTGAYIATDGYASVQLNSEGKAIVTLDVTCAAQTAVVDHSNYNADTMNENNKEMAKQTAELLASLVALEGAISVSPTGQTDTDINLANAKVTAKSNGAQITVHIFGELESGKVYDDSAKFAAVVG
jgi:FKBP-type peptidyl-prolyl cis-trans isomerase